MPSRTSQTTPPVRPASTSVQPLKEAPVSFKVGRPSAERVEAIGQAILVAAADQFLEFGYESTPMEAVAARAGVSKTTLYGRHPTKEHLLRAVVASRIAAETNKLDNRGGPAPADFKLRLLRRARDMMASMASAELNSVIRMVESAGVQDLARALHEAGHQRAVAMLAEDIAESTRHFAAPPRDATRVAEMLMAILYGWYASHSRVRQVSQDEAIAYAEHAIDVLFAGRSAW